MNNINQNLLLVILKQLIDAYGFSQRKLAAIWLHCMDSDLVLHFSASTNVLFFYHRQAYYIMPNQTPSQ